jgi:hypothetical protein
LVFKNNFKEAKGMNGKLLQSGDLVRLEKGMNVNTSVPRMFVNPSIPFSTELAKTSIVIGEPLYRSEPCKKDIADSIKKALSYFGLTTTDDQTMAIVDNLNIDLSPIIYDTSIYEGEYTVIRAISEELGSGVYLHEKLPNCIHIYCSKKDDPSIVVDFFQSDRPSEINTDQI